MDNTIYDKEINPIIGIPYKNINWEDIPGQPFGVASQFNLFVFGDANNIVDVEGAMAVGGSFYSTRGLSIGFQRENGQVPIEFSPDLVRYLVGNIASVKGPLVVIGHAVSGGNFHGALGSTYYIGKNDLDTQIEELKYLYQANGGSPYWTPSDKGEYYIISSYDVPRIIPASRISANLSLFFQSARKSIETFKDCIESLDMNGTVASNSYEWVLTGSNPIQNVFTLDVKSNGLLNKGIRFNIPKESVAIVRLQTGPHAHLQYGLYGEERFANQILYVFEDATNIHMEKSSDIWGSILAPQATFHGHPTGGRVSGNAVLGGFAVNVNSGFEFHLYPFAGGVICGVDAPIQATPEVIPAPINTPLPEIPAQIITPEPIISICPEPIPCPVCPAQVPCPTCPEVKEQIPCPTCPTCPEAIVCPKQIPCPTCPTCPEAIVCPKQIPCPDCPTCPTCPTCPEQIPCPTCPEQTPCPTCPTCPTCPEQIVCPTCPQCPDCPEKETEYIAVPIPLPFPVREEQKVPVCEECLIVSGIIAGCVMGCNCSRTHEWDISLFQIVNGCKKLIYCISICYMGSFQFEVDYEGSYILKICPSRRNCFSSTCKPKVTFYNIGVANFTIE